jgi:hypothetical protein
VPVQPSPWPRLSSAFHARHFAQGKACCHTCIALVPVRSIPIESHSLKLLQLGALEETICAPTQCSSAVLSSNSRAGRSHEPCSPEAQDILGLHCIFCVIDHLGCWRGAQSRPKGGFGSRSAFERACWHAAGRCHAVSAIQKAQYKEKNKEGAQPWRVAAACAAR